MRKLIVMFALLVIGSVVLLQFTLKPRLTLHIA